MNTRRGRSVMRRRCTRRAAARTRTRLTRRTSGRIPRRGGGSQRSTSRGVSRS
uniref:Uncharacterized protein n=1 Tax=Arundo donax TaxID=35708 RepID=A0A0A9GKF2_ARUDO